ICILAAAIAAPHLSVCPSDTALRTEATAQLKKTAAEQPIVENLLAALRRHEALHQAAHLQIEDADSQAEVERRFDPLIMRKRFDPLIMRKRFDPLIMRKRFDPLIMKRFDPLIMKRFDPLIMKRFDPLIIKRFDPLIMRK
uniref:PSCyt2 domain-containing protein n=1 Tax=Macrostomum lignano TaxID=282301 RepID=A0A1I8HH48_9PLAT